MVAPASLPHLSSNDANARTPHTANFVITWGLRKLYHDMFEVEWTIDESEEEGCRPVGLRTSVGPEVDNVSRSPMRRPSEQRIAHPVDDKIGMLPANEPIFDRNEASMFASRGSERSGLSGSHSATKPSRAVKKELLDHSTPQTQGRTAAMDANGFDCLYMRHYHLQNQRGETIDTRIDVIGRRSALQQRITDYRQAQDKVLVLLQNISPNVTESEHTVGLLSAISTIQQLQEGLDQDLEQTKQLEKKLSSLEFEFGKEENEFFGYLRAAVPDLIKAAQVSEKPPAAEPEHPQSTSPKAQGDALLQPYYDRISEIPILEERLSELEYTFADERAQRETRTNLGQPISPPDLEFYTQYNQDKEDLQQELSQMKSEAATLRSRCIRLGLIPEPPEPPSFGAGTGAVPEEEIQRAQSWAYPPKSANELDRSFLSERLTLPSNLRDNPRERINVWLEEAQAIAGAPELLPLEDDPENKAPQTAGSPLNAALPREESPLELSWSELEEAQSKPKRNISDSSTISKLSRADQEPLQKTPKSS